MPIKFDPAGLAHLNAARQAFRGLPKDLKNIIRRSQRSEVGPIWKQEVATQLGRGTATQQAVFKTGTKVKAGLPMYLSAGGGTRPLSGGARPVDLARPVEVGSGRRSSYTKYRRKARGATKATAVTRRAGMQLPSERKSGYVVFPALAHSIPRIIGTWVQGLTDRIYDAVDGR